MTTTEEPRLNQRHRNDSGMPSPTTSSPSKKHDVFASPSPTRPPTRNPLVRHASKYAFTTIVVLSFLTRYWKIWSPSQIVFDEVHFGKFASYYLRRQYYFDVHPPLAKMLIALGGWLVGYDGHFLFEKIGLDYVSNGVPYILLRGWVAIFGFAIPPLVYMIMAESGYSVMAASLGALCVTFDNALVTQGRLILLDNIMIFFMLAAIYSYIKFFKLRYKQFTVQWWTWLLFTGAMLGCAVSCKLVGLLTIALVGVAVIYDLYRILDIRRGTTLREFGRHFAARAFALIAVPASLYLAFFYVHFAVLTHTGTGDAYHTSSFQMQLVDNPMTKSSLDVHFGDQITFKHRDSGVYLHSSTDRYPLQYPDNRISSQGHQVTGAKAIDDGSYWIIKPTQDYEQFFDFFTRKQAGEEISPEEMQRWRVRNADVVQIQHIATTANLRTHDVASPMTPTNMEFTTVPLNDTKSFSDTLWKIQIDGAKSSNSTILKTTSSFIRITSQKYNVAMWTHAKKLPEWGHRHQEVNGNKSPDDKSNIWSISEIRGRVMTEDEIKENQKKTPKLGFWAKYIELQGLMIKHNNALTSVHPFQSTPITWPFLTRGISFWTNSKEHRQIYLLGNPVGWWLSDASLFLYVLAIATVAILDQRGVDYINPVVRRHLRRSTGFIALAWFIHYFPFFMMGRSLFLHHYLPSSIFAYIMLAACFQLFNFPEYPMYALKQWNARARAVVPSVWAAALFAAIVSIQIATFVFFAPISYGTTGLDPDQVKSRMWLKSYDLHYQK